jgi:hypothetical protein
VTVHVAAKQILLHNLLHQRNEKTCRFFYSYGYCRILTNILVSYNSKHKQDTPDYSCTDYYPFCGSSVQLLEHMNPVLHLLILLSPSYAQNNSRTTVHIFMTLDIKDYYEELSSYVNGDKT